MNSENTKINRTTWNKGKLMGQKPPLKTKKIWAIRITENMLEEKGGKSNIIRFILKLFDLPYF
jgi:hypothetical protein